MRTLTITVTAEDIENGKTGDVCECPIALACRRAGLGNPEVESAMLEYDVTPGLRGLTRFQSAATAFVKAFDDGKEVQPFAFEVQIEDPEDAYERRAEAYGDDY